MSEVVVVYCFQAEDGIRDLVRSRGLGDVYKRQGRPFDQQRQALAKGVLEKRNFIASRFVKREFVHLSEIQ